jgi:hypothetical protein
MPRCQITRLARFPLRRRLPCGLVRRRRTVLLIKRPATWLKGPSLPLLGRQELQRHLAYVSASRPRDWNATFSPLDGRRRSSSTIPQNHWPAIPKANRVGSRLVAGRHTSAGTTSPSCNSSVRTLVPVDSAAARLLEMIEAGILPSYLRLRTFDGFGSGQTCAGCRLPIRAAQIEVEGTGDERTGTVLRFHRECLDAWAEAARRIRGADVQHGVAVGQPDSSSCQVEPIPAGGGAA